MLDSVKLDSEIVKHRISKHCIIRLLIIIDCWWFLVINQENSRILLFLIEVSTWILI